MYYQNKNSSLGWSIALVILVAVIALGAIVALLPETEGGPKDQINDLINGAVNSGSDTSDPNNSNSEPNETTNSEVVGGDPKCEHVWDDGVATKEVTCTANGVTTYTCVNEGCTATYTKTIIAKGHSYDDYEITLAPTCTFKGVKTLMCVNCDSTKNETLKAIGHDYVEFSISKEATCTAAGTKLLKCNNCQNTKDEIIPMLGHAYGPWSTVTGRTCTNSGLESRTCARCQGVDTQVIPAYGHAFVDRYISNGDGTHTLVCSACSYTSNQTSHCFAGSNTITYVDDTKHSFKCHHCSGTVTTSHSKIPNSSGVMWCPACEHVFE